MNKIIKVIKIGGGLGINLPKVFTTLLGITSKDKLDIQYDMKKKCIIIKKIED